jgi:hypothetical protein
MLFYSVHEFVFAKSIAIKINNIDAILLKIIFHKVCRKSAKLSTSTKKRKV